jgi:hypothetical protein
LQRTGNACVNEAGFPPNSFDAENAHVFYDYTCAAESGGIAGCHRTRLAQQSCLEALQSSVGFVETAVELERLEWDDELAAEVRVGEVSQPDGPDLRVVAEDLNNYRVVYRYFAPDSCAIQEQCVGGSGWRRLLQFDATVHNVGTQPLHIGLIANDPLHNLFQYNVCHGHFHFSDYGDFLFAGEEQNLSSKQAFCVESTGRPSNNEWSPLTHSYTCGYQGVQAGWVDEYHAGLECQWIDITGLEVPDDGSPVTLGFAFNPNQFLCEGTPVLDAQGNRLWEPSGLTAADGTMVERPQCDFVPDWDANNLGSAEVTVRPAGSFVTEACPTDLLGPLRNCGFQDQTPARPPACQPGESVQLSCTLPEGAAPQVLRLCDFSDALGTGVGCTYQDALVNTIVGPEPAEVSFTCPAGRDVSEPGGSYSLYVAPLLPEDDVQPLACE